MSDRKPPSRALDQEPEPRGTGASGVVGAPQSAFQPLDHVAAKGYPPPYFQPDRTKDCGYYSVAYIARCFGLDVTADEVKAWRAATNRHEDHYLTEVHGIPMRKPGDDRRDGKPYQQWWMGPDQREWVTELLAANIVLVHLLRIPTMHHSVVALEALDEGVLLMDPIYGHVVEPWDWFLGPGPGHQMGTHALWAAHPRERVRRTPACWCGNPDDRERVHRAQACEAWQTRASGAVTTPARKAGSDTGGEVDSNE